MDASLIEGVSNLLDRVDLWFLAVPVVLKVAGAVISCASVIAAATPSKRDDELMGTAGRWYAKLRRAVGFLALNVVHARPGSKSAQSAQVALDALQEVEKTAHTAIQNADALAPADAPVVAVEAEPVVAPAPVAVVVEVVPAQAPAVVAPVVTEPVVLAAATPAARKPATKKVAPAPVGASIGRKRKPPTVS